MFSALILKGIAMRSRTSLDSAVPKGQLHAQSAPQQVKAVILQPPHHIGTLRFLGEYVQQSMLIATFCPAGDRQRPPLVLGI